MNAVIHKAIVSLPELWAHWENQIVLSKLNKRDVQTDEFIEEVDLNSERKYDGVFWQLVKHGFKAPFTSLSYFRSFFVCMVSASSNTCPLVLLVELIWQSEEELNPAILWVGSILKEKIVLFKMPLCSLPDKTSKTESCTLELQIFTFWLGSFS